MNGLQVLSGLDKDYIACHLRRRITSLQNLLNHIEGSEDFEVDYTCESLKLTEGKLRALRKFINPYHY